MVYVDANSVDNNKQMETGKIDLLQFNVKELYAIQEISDETNLFRLLVNSLCPGIYGHELVKGRKIIFLAIHLSITFLCIRFLFLHFNIMDVV